jgi:hypothetical protein
LQRWAYDIKVPISDTFKVRENIAKRPVSVEYNDYVLAAIKHCNEIWDFTQHFAIFAAF